MTNKIFLIIFLLLLLITHSLKSQHHQGVIIDSKTKQPLPFVNIKYDGTQNGTTTDVNGRFEIPAIIEKIHLFYVGYSDTIINLKQGKKWMEIAMNQSAIDLSEVQIFPGINPAHRIISLSIDNRKQNRPENLSSFSYVSYNKMIFTADPDTAAIKGNDSIPADSLQIRLLDFIEQQHFFLMEAVTKRSFLNGKTHEIVKASRVSGLENPFFMMLATQFQSFSFYEPQFNILGKNYINPLTQGSLQNYFYLLQDTLFQESDTVFVITFRPLKNKSFDGMKGILYINSDGYAVQNVIAEPYTPDTSGIGIKIQQLYKKIDGKAWFPTQLNTTFSFGNLLVNNMPVVGLGTSYLDSILINPPLSKSLFRGKVTMEVAKNASDVLDTEWNKYRHDSLTLRDQNTYHFLDSIGKAENLDRKIKSVRILATGKIPLGKFSIPIDRLVKYNEFEKFRLGIAFESNDRLSRYITAMVYGAYGFGDKKIKYGGNLNITPVPNSDFVISFGIANDIEESGAAYQFNSISYFSSDIYRSILINKMNHSREAKAGFQIRLLKHFLWKAGLSYSQKSALDNYSYIIANQESVSVLKSDFNLIEATIGTRVALGEKLIRNPEKLVNLGGSKWPVLNINYTRGIKTEFSDFSFNKFDFQIDKRFHMRYYGQLSVSVKGGFVDRDLPWYLLYNSLGSYRNFYIHASNSFNTMRINEFLSDRWLAFFCSYDIGKLIFKTNKNFSPDWQWVNNIGWGDMKNPQNHRNIEIKTMEKGYFETGLLLNNILKSSFVSYGFGAFYRYGPYAFPHEKDNFSYRLSVGFTF